MRVDFRRRNAAVVLEELTACWADMCELFLVPKDVFGVLVEDIVYSTFM